MQAAFPRKSEQPFYGPVPFFPLCAAFSYFHATGCDAYYFTTDGYGIFNVRTNVGACRTHEGGSGINRSAQVDSEGQENYGFL